VNDKLYPKYFKIQIYPTEDQKTYIDYCINCARYIYNWAIAKEKDQFELYKAGKADKQFLAEKDLRKLYKELKSEKGWLDNFHLEPARYIISRVEYAFDMFFKHHCRYPKFKTRKNEYIKNAFTYRIRHDRFYIDGSGIRIEGFKRGELINCKYDTGIHMKDDIQYHGVNVIRDNLGNYFVSFHLYLEKPIIDNRSNQALGIDLNARLDHRVVCSDGTIYHGVNTKSIEKRIRKYNDKYIKDVFRLREMEKTNPDAQMSKRAKRNIRKFRRANKKLRDVNTNWVNHISNEIIKKNPSTIVMEGLDIIGMNKKPYIAKQIHFVPLFRFRELVQYKCNKFNIPFILADRDFKSTQICSNCGAMKKMYSQKTYICKECGLRIDRDINAAINLEKLAYC